MTKGEYPWPERRFYLDPKRAAKAEAIKSTPTETEYRQALFGLMPSLSAGEQQKVAAILSRGVPTNGEQG